MCVCVCVCVYVCVYYKYMYVYIQIITETKAIKKGYHYPLAKDRVPVVNHESTQVRYS